LTVAAGGASTCALKKDRALQCWGELVDPKAPVAVPTPVSSGAWQTVAVSGHACATRANGSLYCWGANDSGQVGDGTSPGKTTPNRVKTELHFQAMAIQGGKTCAIATDSSLYCWGVATSQLPERVGTDQWLSIAAGQRQSCGVTSDGALNAWVMRTCSA
jgi:alpha-tubulin suppressor-like RCC1 family protein